MTKAQAIKILVREFGCTLVDARKGQSSVKLITPRYPDQIAVVNAQDLVTDFRSGRA